MGTAQPRRGRGTFRTSVVAVSNGKAFVIDMDEEDKDNEEPFGEPAIGMVLHVIDIQSGVFLQTVRLEIEGPVSAVIADGDEIYIADNRQVVVLQLAGSEA